MVDGLDLDPSDVELDVPAAVYDRIREKHGKCDPAGCGLRRLWVEDVQEIVEMIREVQS